LLTGLCWFTFDRRQRRFRLASVHPGHTVEEVRDQTGFDFDLPPEVPATAPADAATLALLRGRVAQELGETYPRFVTRVFPQAGAAA
jgi:glutaconate CoA-transferase subunit B